MNDTGYNSTCLSSGEWNGMPACALIHCDPLVVDTSSVTFTDMTTTYYSDNITSTEGYIDDQHSGTTGYSVGTLYQAQCTQFGDDFNFGENIIRTYLFCNKT